MYTYLELCYEDRKNAYYFIYKIIMLWYCRYTEQVLNVRGNALQFWVFMCMWVVQMKPVHSAARSVHMIVCVTHQHWPINCCASGMPVSAPMSAIFESCTSTPTASSFLLHKTVCIYHCSIAWFILYIKLTIHGTKAKNNIKLIYIYEVHIINKTILFQYNLF